MADYSYVELQFSEADLHALGGEKMGAILAAAEAESGLPVPTWTSGVIEVVVEEARYGFPTIVHYSGAEPFVSGDEGLYELVKLLMDNGVPFTAADAGGYEWPEAEYAYHPDYGLKMRALDGAGGVVLMAHQWEALLTRETQTDQWLDEFIATVTAHFDPDPRGWL